MRARAWWSRSAPGVTSVAVGDHVIPLYTPECRQCKSCLSRKTNLCTAIRATQGKGLMPDGTSRFSYKGQPIAHYMGCSTFANFTVLPEIAVAKIREDAPFDKACYIGCGVTTGVGAVVNTAKVEPGANCIVFGLGGIGLNVIQGLKMVGADMIIGVDINPATRGMGPLRHDPLRQSEGRHGDIVAHLVALTDGGADYTFDCTGNTTVMRQALEACHRGWGESIIIGVAEGRQGDRHPPVPAGHRPRLEGHAFGGARGRTDVPKIVDWYMDGKIEIDPMITHTMPLEDINKAFDLMHAGESIRSVRIGLSGHSMGGHGALTLGAEEPAKVPQHLGLRAHRLAAELPLGRKSAEQLYRAGPRSLACIRCLRTDRGWRPHARSVGGSRHRRSIPDEPAETGTTESRVRQGGSAAVLAHAGRLRPFLFLHGDLHGRSPALARAAPRASRSLTVRSALFAA
jgi:S-(hydroxymethyl)glutathione dehydrogenase/alcohol dehydrogenase